MAKPPSEGEQGIFRRPKHLSLVDIAYQALVEAIVNQQLAPGTPVIIETLVRELNMSNTPVREALMRVAGERLVKQKSNRGFVVADILTPRELKELFEVRFVLETHALRIGEITDAAVDRLDELARQMSETKDGLVYQDFKDFLEADHAFHQTLASLPENSFLDKAWEDLHVHLHLSRLYTGVGLFDRGDSAGEHLSIIQALRERNRDQAIAVLGSHIRDVEGRLMDFLTSA